jgi:hypothetical protein
MMKKFTAVMLVVAVLMPLTITGGAAGRLNEFEYARVSDALAILRECVGLANDADVSTHDFNGNNVIDVGDALLVLRGVVGIGEPQVLGVKNLEPMSEELGLRIQTEWAEAYNKRHGTNYSFAHIRIICYLGVYNDNMVFMVDTRFGRPAWGVTVAGYDFGYTDSNFIEVLSDGVVYDLRKAYESGLLTEQDVRSIYFWYYNRNRR